MFKKVIDQNKYVGSLIFFFFLRPDLWGNNDLKLGKHFL